MKNYVAERFKDVAALVTSKVFWSVVLFAVGLYLNAVDYLPPVVGEKYSEIANLIAAALLIFGLWDSVQSTFMTWAQKVRAFVKETPGIAVIVAIVFYLFDNYTDIIPDSAPEWIKFVVYALGAGFAAMGLRSSIVIAAASDPKQFLQNKKGLRKNRRILMMLEESNSTN